MEVAPLHALVLPFPSQGHINPMLHLSMLLSSRGSFVTFVNTQRSHQGMLESQAAAASSAPLLDLPNIRFVCIPDGIPPDCNFYLNMSLNAVARVLDGIEQQQHLLQELIISSRSNPAAPPISCIISDAFFPWTQDLANMLKIARVICWTTNLTSLYALKILATGGPSTLKDLSLEKQEILSPLVSTTPELEAWLLKRMSGIDEAACILLNTFRDLEDSIIITLPELELKPPLLCVGPVFSPDTHDQNNMLNRTSVSTKASLLKEEVSCLQWLDTHATCSVLYISFGSVVSFSPAQIEQLALGIEASGHPFLWVARSDKTSFPEDFVDRIKDRGLIIGWGPQLRVLEHPAISCFLTHCGWNSTLEAIWAGIPMLCLPVFPDQRMNEKLVVKVWQVGLGFEKKSDDGLVGREEVKKVAMEMMHSEESRKIRDRSAYWKAMARHAVREGGPSHADLTRLLEDMGRYTQKS